MEDMHWSFFVYFLSLGLGLILALVSGFLSTVLGGDHDISADHDLSVDHDIGVDHDISVDHDFGPGDVHLSPVSPPVMSTFLSIFGAGGLFLEGGLHLPWYIATPISGTVAIVLSIGVIVVLGKLLTAAQGTSHISLGDLIGTESTVITPIPANGLGEIAYSAPTGRGSMPARSETGTLIPKHSMVTITQVVGNTAMVRETIDEQLRNLPSAVDEAEATGSETGASREQVEAEASDE